MSGEALIHAAELTPSKEAVAARYAGIVTLLGSYRLVDPDGEVGIEVLVGSDLDGRTVQLPLSYRSAELDPEHTLTQMEHSVLGTRWVSNALGDPVAVAQFIRTIMEGDDGAVRSDGVPAALDIRGSGTEEKVEISDVVLYEVTRQRVVGAAKINGRTRPFQLLMPHLLRRLNVTGTGANTARLHLVGWLPTMPEKQRVAAELSVRD